MPAAAPVQRKAVALGLMTILAISLMALATL